MTRKAFIWLIVDLILAGIVTTVCVLLRNHIVAGLGDANAHILLGVKVLFTGLYILIDGIILVWYLFFWWCEQKWAGIKRHFGY